MSGGRDRQPSVMRELGRLYGPGPRRRFGLRRDLLPPAEDYFSARLKLRPGSGPWRSAPCCFHEDKTPSLRVNIETGAFRCFGCGAKGGDVLDFERLLHGLTFTEAARSLRAWGEL